MKDQKTKDALIKHLKKRPIVEFACSKSGVARSTYYRWRKNNSKFVKQADEALREGCSLISEMAESQLINAIKDGNFQAIKFWLTSHHKDYNNKLEITHNDRNKELSASQKELIKKALELTSAHRALISKKYENHTK